MRFQIYDYTILTSSGIVYNSKCYFCGFLIGTDGINNPTITFYNNITNTGDAIVPTQTFNARVLGLNGVAPGFYLIPSFNGLYCEITTAGACQVTGFYRKF